MKELTAEELIEWKCIITDVLREFDKICHENNLRYFACGGTAIGAIRHQGIIPWDDDIDVSMPRPDYDRFLEICSKRDMGDYELLTPYNTEKYPLPFAKMSSRKTTLIETKELPFLMGAFIDIFPLDGTNSDVNEAAKLKDKYNRIWHKLEAATSEGSFSEYISLLMKPHEWGRFIFKTLGFLSYSLTRKYLLKSLHNISCRYPFESAENVIVYAGSYGAKEIIPKSFCDGKDIRIPFEGISIMMPSGYETYLTRIYGNYMQIPPKERQISHHYHAMYDLTKRLTKEEALSQLG